MDIYQKNLNIWDALILHIFTNTKMKEIQNLKNNHLLDDIDDLGESGSVALTRIPHLIKDFCQFVGNITTYGWSNWFLSHELHHLIRTYVFQFRIWQRQ